MGHANFKTKTKNTERSSSAREWLGLSAAVGRMVNEWSGRTDIAAFAAPGAGAGNPAFFNPRTSEVEVDVTTCFGDDIKPNDIGDLDRRSKQYEWPRATGAIFHEALHCRFSRWDIDAAVKELTPAEFNALILFEEGRIESQGIKLYPSNAGFLRTTALDIVVGDPSTITSSSDTVFASNVAALTLGRVDAGSLEEADVREVRAAIADKLNDETLDKLRELWVKAQAHVDHRNPERLYGLAREWVKIVDQAAAENGDPGSDEAGEGEGGGISEFAKGLLDAMTEAAEGAAVGAFDDLWDAETRDAWEEELKAKSDDNKTKSDALREASKVFGKDTTVIDSGMSGSRLMEKRAPLGNERAAAVKIARLLEKAKYRERDQTEVTSIVPPGRLRTRAALQSSALRSKGLMSQAEPWRRIVRKHTEDPTLSIGVMVDISGSMGGAMEPMAVTAWVLSEAVRRVQGKVGMVYFGTDVFATLKPGQHLDSVAIMSAPDGTEKFDRGFKALNGGLNLTWGTGARLLVVVSDGVFTGEETKAAKRSLRLCKSAGVGVLWLAFNGYDREARNICHDTGAVVCTIGSDPAGAATEIGSAAAQALSAIR